MCPQQCSGMNHNNIRRPCTRSFSYLSLVRKERNYHVELCEGEMISWPRQDALINDTQAEHLLNKVQASHFLPPGFRPAHAASMTAISQFAPIIRWWWWSLINTQHFMSRVNTDGILFSLSVSLVVFLLALGCLISRPSAKRTILLTTPASPLLRIKRRKTRNHSDDNLKKDNVNPIYWWIVQPQEETGLKEGRFSLARASRKVFPYDKERRSSSLYTDSSSGDLSRTSSISMSTIMTSLSISRAGSDVSSETRGVTSSRSTSLSEYGACELEAAQAPAETHKTKQRASFLHSVLKSPLGSSWPFSIRIKMLMFYNKEKDQLRSQFLVIT